MQWGEVDYAKSGEHHIAFREVLGDGGGDQEIVMVSGGFWPMDSFPDDPIANRLIEGLADLGRLVLFDRRGVALSDPITDWETSLTDQWADDLAAVITAAGCDRPTVFAWTNNAMVARCVTRSPNLIGRLMLFNPTSPVTDADEGWFTEYINSQERTFEGAEQDLRYQAFPGRRGDPDFQAWQDRAGRAGASPTQARRLIARAFADPPVDWGLVELPTVVIARTPPEFYIPVEFFERAADQIPNAQLVKLPPGDVLAVGAGVDDLLATVSEHLTGEVRLPPPERQLAVVLFTDLVDSTRRAASAGDAEWKRLLDRHDAINAREVQRRGGEVVKSTGDGILALMPSASAAIEAARSIQTGLAFDDLHMRTGIHIGEIDRRGDDVSGLEVNTAARIMSIADADQIVTSSIVQETTDVATFTSIGPTALKNIEGTRELFIAH